METCETIRIVGRETPYIVINKEDFNPAKHEVFRDASDQFSGMTNAQLKAHLTAEGVEIPHNANKATLLELCRG